MALTRAFLKDLGIVEKDHVDAIMDENGATIEDAKEKARAAAERAAEAAAKREEKLRDVEAKLKDQLAALQEKLDGALQSERDAAELKRKNEGLIAELGEAVKKSEYESLKGEFDTYKANVEAKESEDAKRAALAAHLAADGANPKLIGLLEKEFDLSKVELEGDAIKGWEELSKPVKERYAEVFAIEERRDFEPGKHPPDGGGGEKNPWLKEHRSLSEQTRIYREDPARAVQMAKAAGVILR